MRAIKIEIHTIKERIRRTDSLPALYFSGTLPAFFINEKECLLPNQTLSKISDCFFVYLKNILLEKISYSEGARFPVHGNFHCNIPRMDRTLLSVEVILNATSRQGLLFSRHIHLHFANDATLPLTGRQLTGKRIACPALFHEKCMDMKTNKIYPLRKKYQKKESSKEVLP